MAIITYAGIKVGQTTGTDPSVGMWVYQNIRPQDLFPLASRTWPGTIAGGPILDQTFRPWRPVVLDALFWPWSASRFARAHFAIRDTELNQIRKIVQQTTGTGSYQSALLTIQDGVNAGIQTQMYMLPAIPLQTGQTAATQGMDLWLLTLVDQRYFWWEASLSYTVNAGVTAWTDIYNTIATALGITIAADTVNANYGTPTIDYSDQDRPVPPILDAVAFSCGQRIVRGLDGTVKAQNPLTALANAKAQVQLFQQYAGGILALTPG